MLRFKTWICPAIAAGLAMALVGCGKKPIEESQSPAGQASAEAPSETAEQAASQAPLDEQGIEARERLAAAIDAQLARRYDEAMKLFQEALQMDPNLAGVKYQMAVVAMNQGNEPESMRLAYEAVANNEQADQAYNLIGTMAARAKDYAVAEWAFRRAQEANPADAMAFYNASEALRHQGKFPDAVNQLRAAIQRNPGEPLFALKLRLARIESGEGDAMIPEVQQQLSVTPPAGDWMLTAAAISLANERYEEAAAMLSQARGAMQPILFFGILQEDPFFSKFRQHPVIAPFTDVEIQVTPPEKTEDKSEAGSAN
jgi:tetratricopeptide (TPR) repeat protein